MPKLVIFIINFAISKLSIYLVPLIIAAVASAEIYGAIEFGWAFALLIANIMTGAPTSGVSQRYLIRKDREVMDELAMIALAGGGVGLVAWICAQAAGASGVWKVAVASIGVAVLHNVASTLFRTRGQRNLTTWFDGTATLAGGLLVLGLLVIFAEPTVDTLAGAYAVVASVIALGGFLSLTAMRRPFLIKRFLASWVIGLPMLSGGILAMWLGVGGRMMVGFLDPSQVGVYSLMFRVAGVALGIHQLAVTSLYARLYAARTREADRLLLPFLAAVAVFTISIALVAPYLIGASQFEALRGDGEAVFRQILPVVCIQIFYWIAFALLQLRVNRSGLAGRAFWPTFWVALLGTALIVGAARLFDIGLVGLCWGFALHSAGYFGVEVFVLARAKLPHNRVALCALVSGVILTAIALFRQFMPVAA